jgi:putative FmdB family regulatory protein
MPTYEYKCAACDHAFERFQSIKADPIRRCPECGKMKVKRLLGTGAGLIFKGSGFYITDYRSEGYKKAAKAEGGGGGAGGESASTAGEGKPAAADGKAQPKPESSPVTAKPAETKPSASPSSGSSGGSSGGSSRSRSSNSRK